MQNTLFQYILHCFFIAPENEKHNHVNQQVT